MIDINPVDVVAECRDATNRFVIFTRTDRPVNFPLPWFGVCLDTGGDGQGILVRPTIRDPGDGWTAIELLYIAQRRSVAEHEAGANCSDCMRSLDFAARFHDRNTPSGDALRFRHGPEHSPFPWTIVSCRGHELSFSADPSGQGEGVTLEQLLIVIERLHQDWAQAPSRAREAISSAMAACRRVSNTQGHLR